jgi:hypothetical protein
MDILPGAVPLMVDVRQSGSGPPPGRVAGVALPDLDQPAADVLAFQLGRPHLRVLLSEPVGQALDRLQAYGGSTGTSSLLSRSASCAALVTAWSR